MSTHLTIGASAPIRSGLSHSFRLAQQQHMIVSPVGNVVVVTGPRNAKQNSHYLNVENSVLFRTTYGNP